MKRWTLHTSEVLPALQAIADASMDAVLSDVPYGLGAHQPTIDELIAYLTGSDLDMKGDFMGHDWQIPSLAVWRELFRVLKPGAPIFIFGGSHTIDLIALGMRAAGFEIKDTISWLQGQGMPKPASTTDKYLDAHFGVEREVVGSRVLTGNAAISTAEKGGTFGIQVGSVPAKEVPVTAPGSPEAKRYDGYGHALRPSHEPIVVGRKPLEGTIAENILAHDVGALNVKGCRLSSTANDPGKWHRTGSKASENVALSGPNMERAPKADVPGRWPPNVIFTHEPGCVRTGTRKVKAAPAWNDNRPTPAAFTGAATSAVHHAEEDGTEIVESWECVEGCAVRELDKQSGILCSHGGGGTWPGGGGFQNGGKNADYRPIAKGDSGGASRFFPCFAYEPKVDKAEREFGCEHLPLRTAGETVDREEGTPGIENGAAGAGRTGGARNHHPCLKPIAVTTWLAKLQLPPPRKDESRTILVPYCGSGSEMIGAIRAGWDHVVGIERDASFVAIAEARLSRWADVPIEMEPADVKPAKVDERQVGLFDRPIATNASPKKRARGR